MGSKAHQRRRARRRPGIAGSAVRRAREDKTSCTRGEAPIARLAGATTSKWPCTMSPAAQRPGCRAMRCLSRAGQCGRRRSKQDSTRMQADARKTREWARARHAFTAATCSPTARRAAPVRQPLSHSRVLRASACICVTSFLLRRAPHAAPPDPGPCAQARIPCTNSPACRRWLFEQTGSRHHRVLPEPHAPIRAAFAADNSQGRETPHAQRAVARPALPTVSPRSAHETMARLVRDRSGCYSV